MKFREWPQSSLIIANTTRLATRTMHPFIVWTRPSPAITSSATSRVSKHHWLPGRPVDRINQGFRIALPRPTGRFDGLAPIAWTGTQTWQTADPFEAMDRDRIHRRRHGDRDMAPARIPHRAGGNPETATARDTKPARSREVKADLSKASRENSSGCKRSWRMRDSDRGGLARS
jgi:hypothetical protein